MRSDQTEQPAWPAQTAPADITLHQQHLDTAEAAAAAGSHENKNVPEGSTFELVFLPGGSLLSSLCTAEPSSVSSEPPTSLFPQEQDISVISSSLTGRLGLQSGPQGDTAIPPKWKF